MTPFDPGVGLRIAFALRIGGVALTLLAARRTAVCRLVGFIGSALASLVTAATAAAMLQAGASRHGELLLHRASQFSLTYTVDGLSAWFLIVLSTLAIPIAIFSIGYFAHGHFAAAIGLRRRGVQRAGRCRRTRLRGERRDHLPLCLGADDADGRGAGDHRTRGARQSARRLSVPGHVARGHRVSDRRVPRIGIRVRLGHRSRRSCPATSSRGPMRDALFGLFFIGFGVKAGVIPLHVWLPEAHPAAPTSISALMSGVLLKAGIYGIVRVCAFGLGVPRLSWGVIVVALGGLSAVLGVLYALMQHDLKRLLAYHSVENIGIILLGLGAGMMALAYGRSELAWIGVAASLYHVLNHAVFKGLLFLGAGDVVMTTGTRQIEQFGGLLRRMPWTGLFFLVGAMAISGLPPLNGFASEWLTFQAFLYGFRGSAEPLVHFLFPVGGALLALTTALAAACFVKAFGISFLALPRSGAAAGAHEVPAVMLVPQAMLAALCVVLGLFPGVVLRVLGRVLASLPAIAAAGGHRMGRAWDGVRRGSV